MTTPNPETEMQFGDVPLTMDRYQREASVTAIYPGPTGSMQALAYVTMGLSGEAGEIANQVKKILRDDDGKLSLERRSALIKELGDVLWYVAMLAEELDTSLGMVAISNLEKLKARHMRGVIGGSGDDR